MMYCAGTMQYIRGRHIDAHRDQSLRALPRVVDGGRTLEHLHEPGWNEETQRNGTVTGFMTIPEDNLPTGEVVTVDVEQGEMIVTSNIMPHRSLPNWSEEMRWSCDWRVQDMRLPHGWGSNEDGSGGGCCGDKRSTVHFRGSDLLVFGFHDSTFSRR